MPSDTRGRFFANSSPESPFTSVLHVKHLHPKLIGCDEDFGGLEGVPALIGHFELQVQNPEKKKGFHEYERKAMPYRDHKDRVLDWEEVYASQTKKSPQAALDDDNSGNPSTGQKSGHLVGKYTFYAYTLYNLYIISCDGRVL